MNDRNIILTGVPRSGTTLACRLLNKLAGVVALHEPMNVREWRAFTDHDAVCDTVEDFFKETRASIVSRGRAISTEADGEVPDNFRGGYSLKGLRTRGWKRGEILIDKPLAPDFLLIVKHTAEFTCILERLSKRFPAYAIIRNPLSILASWSSVDLAVNTGRSPNTEGLDPLLHQTLESIEDTTERQLRLLSWLFAIYRRVLPPASILRYEEIVETRGKALRIVTPAAEALDEPLASKNQNEAYSPESMRKLGEKLLSSDGAYWDFYSRESVESLLDDVNRRPRVKQEIARTMPICITGMHRSGTSMVAGLLHDCGLYLGDERDLLPATEHNADGHWEHRRFVELSDEFLSALGGGWDCPPDVAPDWSSQAALQDTRAMASTLATGFAGHAVWGWKDPRVCLTLPLWKELVPDLKVVICVRNPLEVAHSLRRRGAMSYALGLKLWRTYNERILEATRPDQRLITHYEAYFRNPLLELRRVIRFLNLTVTTSVIESASGRVQSQLRHHRFAAKQLEDTPMGVEAMALYARMCEESGWRENPPGPLLASKPLSVLQYQELVRRVQAAASRLEAGAVIVVSRGDDALLQLNGCRAWHFPQDDKGLYSGNYPADGAAVIESLQKLCARGGDHILFPQTAFWWLDHYDGLRQYLETRGRRVLADDDCIIYRLTD